MSKLTVQQVIDESMARGAEYVSVTASVWNDRFKCNSGVQIYTNSQLFTGKTLNEAYAKYMAQFTCGEPAIDTVTEIAATIESK